MTTEPAGFGRRPARLFCRLSAETIYLVTGGLLLLAVPAGVFTGVSLILSTVTLTGSPGTAPEALGPTMVTLIVLTCLTFLGTLAFCCVTGRLHRTRASALLGIRIPRPRRAGWTWRRALVLGTTTYALRVVGYQLFGLLLGPVLIAAVLGCLVGGPTLLVLSHRALSSDGGVPPVIAGSWGVGGLAVLVGAPWIFHGVASMDLALVRWVFGVDEKAALARRVQQVTRARSGIVAAADAERRRIERNLHDGAQQRLTALAVHLGIERSRHTRAAGSGAPPTAEQTTAALTYAQSEVQTALQEIRALVRGLHPAVLEDRGLDAAVSGIASRAPFPISVTVDVVERPSLDVEAVAYFVVSEAVNNIIAHARAEHASVAAVRTGERLTIAVDDDGVGGADERGGTGLTGLRQRVESVDGHLMITSEPGEGTRIRVELQCASS